MKKFIMIVLMVLIIPVVILSGCGSIAQSSADQPRIVCTIFPQYDWTRQILGNKADSFDLTLLLNNRMDLHSYQPSVDDMVKISTCDLFIYIGGESDVWVDDALRETSNKDMIVINLLNALGEAAKEEEIIYGVEDEKDGLGDEDIGPDEEGGYDEHVWLSLKNAQTFCSAIVSALSLLDKENTDVYQSNATAYIEQLSTLDTEYQRAIDAASIRTLLFGDRFPFRYLADDYSLSYYAAFPGCSAETEASFETVVFLANKADELNLRNIMVTESADQSIAKTVISNTSGKNQQILILDAMQSVTLDDIQNGSTYLSIMRNNLNVLIEALN